MYLPTQYFTTAGNTRSKNKRFGLPIFLPPQAIQDPKIKYLPTNYFATTNNTRSKINVFAYKLFCHHRQFKIQKLSICLPIILPPQAIQDPKLTYLLTNQFATAGNSGSKNKKLFAYKLVSHRRQFKVHMNVFPTYYFAPTGNTRSKIVTVG